MTSPAAPRDPMRPRLRRGRYGWYLLQRPVLRGGHAVTLLRGGAQLFPAMRAAIDAAQREVWLATYIFNDDAEALAVADALVAAAARGVRVRVVIDGFGTKHSRSRIERRLADAPGIEQVPAAPTRHARPLLLSVFRPIERWTHWLQPGQLRRLHMKLCTVDDTVGYIGGINLIDDHIDLNHGRTEAPRLDYALAVSGPVVETMRQVVRAMWSRAWHGSDWRDALRRLVIAPQPMQRLRGLLRELRMPVRQRAEMPADGGDGSPASMRVALVVRDNVRQRRTIERACIEAMRAAQRRIWLVTPYFYPGTGFRQALADAARRGVEVRLLLQGKADYRLAAWAARALYRELHQHGVHVHEYLPAFLHAKVMLVDDDWCTVGSSNLDPLSLLLNLEANLIVSDAGFQATLSAELERALANSREILPDALREAGWVRLARRAVVAWVAYVYLRVAGVTGRY